MGWSKDNLTDARRRRIAEELIVQGGGRVSTRESRGDELRAICPFHPKESHPSFAYNFADDVWVCSHDARGGNLIKLFCEVTGAPDDREGLKAFIGRFEPDQLKVSGKSRGKTKGRKNKKPTRPAGPGEYVQPEVYADLPPLPENWLKRLEEKRGWSREVMEALGLRLFRERSAEGVAIPIFDPKGNLYNIRKYRPGAPKGRKIRSWWREVSGEIITFGAARLFPATPVWKSPPEPPPGIDDLIFLVEGEPDCLAARSRGLNAVTVTGGAGTWKAPWSAHFAGRDVVICYDHDSAGIKGGLKAARALAKTAKRVRVLAWPDDVMAEHEDLTDWFVKHGRSVDDLMALAASAQVVEAASGPPAGGGDGGGGDDADDVYRFFKQTDRGWRFVSSRLAAELAARTGLVVDRDSQVAYGWTGTHFEPVLIQDLQKLALGWLGEQADMTRVGNAIKQALAHATLPSGETMNVRPELLCLPNGMLDLDTGKILEHDPKYRATYMFPWAFDPAKPEDCPRFKLFLWQVLMGRVEIIRELQRFFGYCLWPDNRYERSLFLIGTAGTGKSTLLDVFQWLVGEDNCSNVNLVDIQDAFSRATLANAALNVFDEADTRYFETNHFNSIACGKPVQARHIYGPPFNFRARCKLIFAANDFPKTRGDARAFLDRLMVLRFTRVFRGTARQDPELNFKLKAELPGIFAWALVGLYYLRKANRFRRSAATKLALADYRADINPLEAYVEERLTTNPDEAVGGEAWVSKADLYADYLAWCKAYGVGKPVQANTLCKRLYKMQDILPGVGPGKAPPSRGRTPIIKGLGRRTAPADY